VNPTQSSDTRREERRLENRWLGVQKRQERSVSQAINEKSFPVNFGKSGTVQGRFPVGYQVSSIL
jgi:hypothetical protein